MSDPSAELETLERYRTAISRSNQNSYKFTLGLAMIDCYQCKPVISYESIARQVVGYYFTHRHRFQVETSAHGE